MELKQVKQTFYKYLKQLNEKEILTLMNYLSLLIHDFNSDYTKFKEILNKELTGFILSDYKDWTECANDDKLFEINSYSININKDSIIDFNSNITNHQEDESIINKKTLDNDDLDIDKKSRILNVIEHKKNIKKEYRRKIMRKLKSIKKEPVDGKLSSCKRISSSCKIRLQMKYEENKFPTRKEMEELADELQLRYNQVYLWFDRNRLKNGHVKSRKKRVFQENLAILNEEFQKSKNPSYESKKKIARLTNLTVAQVTQWFFRQKYKSKI